MNNRDNKPQILICLLLVVIFSSCEKMVDVGQPRSELSKTIVFEDDLTANAALAAIYRQMTVYSFMDITLQPSLSSDDLKLEGNRALQPFYNNELTTISPNVESTWRHCYTAVYTANSIIEGLQPSTNITTSLKTQLMGEAKFFRAFYHFYLVNLFGNVPYITTTDYNINRSVTRTPINEVYVKIIADLIAAQAQLNDDYTIAKGERVRVNKWAATALLARVYLYIKVWDRAEELAGSVIANTGLFSLRVDLAEVFLKNNTEAIWQLIPDYPQLYTFDGAWLNKPGFNLENPRITTDLFNTFEITDKRKSNWIAIGQNGITNFYYPVKYKETSLTGPTGKEYSTVLRLAEQYLIRAEARGQQNKLAGVNGAVADINVIRRRAGLLPTTASTQSDILTEIEKQRRLEFFAEYGHRWFDLKRTDRANNILTTTKSNWVNTDMLYPIPASELRLNPNMTPNPGY